MSKIHSRCTQFRRMSPMLLAMATALSPLTVSQLAHKLIAPIHLPYQPTTEVISSLSPYCTQTMHVIVGPPIADLSLVIVKPILHGKRTGTRASGSCLAKTAPNSSAEGTILLLPGYGMPKATMLPYSTALAAKGYRAVLVDLRAQGESTGEYLGYGKQEARDLVQVLGYLRQHGFVAGKVGLLGISYGAAVALDTAAIDDQISAVVAIAPFARVDPTIHRFLDMSDPQLAATIPPLLLRQAIEQAGHIVGYPLAEADPLRAVSAIRAPVLYLAGAEDPVTPLPDVQALAAKTPHSQIIIEAQKNHLTLTSDVPLIVNNAIQWFERYVAIKPGNASLPRNKKAAVHEQHTIAALPFGAGNVQSSSGRLSSYRRDYALAHT